jgi:EmrB/QacA subfamily drug resistance transporter
MATVETDRSALTSRQGVLILLLLCAVQFLDIVDSSIMNVALPSIRADLGFTQQNLQWVLSGYLVTYGGFLLLGGRATDLFGRRRILLAGTVLFAVCSLIGGLAPTAGWLVAARVVQGIGAALMTPAGLSILTTTFTSTRDRARALSVWGAISGIGAAAGVFLGGVLSEGPGWRWVLFVNLPVCAAIVAAAFVLIPRDQPRPDRPPADLTGAFLVTTGIMVLLYALVNAPESGWLTQHTIGELATAAVLLTVFVVVEQRRRQPLFPFAIFRTKGLVAADLTQLLAFAGFISMFFFLTLYMQNILGYTPIQAGAAYLPVTAGIIIAAGACGQLIPQIGTRPLIIGGAIVAAAGMFYLARVPTDGTYLVDLLPGLLIMSLGLGALFVTVTAAANAGVAPDQAGLAAALINTSLQLGSALGLAIFSALATARTNDALDGGAPLPTALTEGFHRALLAAAVALLLAAVVATRVLNTRQQNPTPSSPEPIATTAA